MINLFVLLVGIIMVMMLVIMVLMIVMIVVVMLMVMMLMLLSFMLVSIMFVSFMLMLMFSITDMLVASRFWLEVASLSMCMILRTNFLELARDLILNRTIRKSLHTIIMPMHSPIRLLMAMRLFHSLIASHILAFISTFLFLIIRAVSIRVRMIRVRVAVVMLTGHESM